VLFPTVTFALFFCVAFLANWLLRPSHSLWRATMIGLSLFFYGYWDPRFVLLLVASIALNYLAGRLVARSRARATPARRRGRLVLAAGVAANLAILGFFKYAGFLATSVESGLGRLGVDLDPPLLDVVLPIGISFFTFQAISYLVDLGSGRLDRPMSLLDTGFFLSFFPQLVAGPIVRATEMAGQITSRPDPRSIPAGEAFWLIAQGLFKKVVISSYLARSLVDPVFDVPGDHPPAEVLLAVYAYAVQIYADFSGYTDIAIGCALLLGFRFPQNFDAPYRALSVAEFWRRWHMSLSRWLRDYLYRPLGGSRRGALRTGRNLAVTMVLGGLWHGAGWTFVAWGTIHGGALIVERVAGRVWRPLGFPAPLVTAAKWLITFHVVSLSWVFFRADTIGQAIDLLGQLGGGRWLPPAAPGLVAVVVAASVAAHFVPDRVTVRIRDGLSGAAPLAQVASLAVTLTVIDALGPQGVAPFIYFQF
jgi:D-alanyl-lipoteichoic acid acyltransferase DltB (MBOAT superfamily)